MAAAEGMVSVTEGAGKNLHSYSRTVGAYTVQEQAVTFAEYPLATYTAVITNISAATANDHWIQVMAGASLNVRIRRIRIWQAVAATAANVGTIELWRLTSAGTGGTAVTPGRYDPSDAAAGAAGMTLHVMADAPAGGGWDLVYEWEQRPDCKPIIIPAGTSNGIAVKGVTAIASATVNGFIEFVETSF
jgi:hypothetical protein